MNFVRFKHFLQKQDRRGRTGPDLALTATDSWMPHAGDVYTGTETGQGPVAPDLEREEQKGQNKMQPSGLELRSLKERINGQTRRATMLLLIVEMLRDY
jgi:hypothetical protein